MSKITMYIQSLHQVKRRLFARAYLEWRRNGSGGVGPMRESYGVSWEAARTVRNRIDELIAEETKREDKARKANA